jgi:hypothetical protein
MRCSTWATNLALGINAVVVDVRVYADDVVEPADGPAEQCAYRRG